MGLFRKKKSIKGTSLLAKDLNFASSEAYKLVRANLQFVLAAQDGNCKMFGVTSPDSGEGKTTTSINLAYTFALTDEKVLLIEGDMRLPNIARCLQIGGKPGLSELLSSPNFIPQAVVKSGILPNLDVIPAGTIPPNPSELLGSTMMKKLLEKMSKQYNYIIVDLPPVTEVSDPMVAGVMLNGVALVVRQDYTPRRSINETIRQLRLAGVNILGIILTMADTGAGYYKKKYKYGKYGYRRDGYRQASSYEAQFEKAAAAAQSELKKGKTSKTAGGVTGSSNTFSAGSKGVSYTSPIGTYGSGKNVADSMIVEDEFEFGSESEKNKR